MAFMMPMFASLGTSLGATAATAATTGMAASSLGLTVLGGIGQAAATSSAADYNTKVATLNAQNSANAAQTNKNILDAKAVQEEAAGQVAADQKRHELAVKLSRAQAVAAAGGGGPPQESLIAGLVDRGETAAQYDLYSSTERAKTLRFQGESGLGQAEAQGALDVSSAKSRENQANTSAAYTVLGSLGKGASMMNFAPSAAPGITARPYADAYSDALYNN